MSWPWCYGDYDEAHEEEEGKWCFSLYYIDYMKTYCISKNVSCNITSRYMIQLTSYQTASNHIIRHQITSNHTASNHIKSYVIKSHQITSNHIISHPHQITSASNHIISNHIISNHIISNHIIYHQITSSHTNSHHITSNHIKVST